MAQDINSRDQLISAEIHRFVNEFQNIEIKRISDDIEKTVSVFVHPPYMCYWVDLIDDEAKFNKIAERHQLRLLRVRDARESANGVVNGFLDRQFHQSKSRERYFASGRAELNEIRAFLQEAVDAKIVPISGGKPHPDGHDLRNWLKKYGVGIDCSGFVQQALKQVISRIQTQTKPFQPVKPEIPFLRCLPIYRNMTGEIRNGESLFRMVATPVQARPGDIVVNRHHMRIVMQASAECDDGLILMLAESTSATDIPSNYAYEEADIGPRIIQLKYPKPYQAIAHQNPLKKRLIDDSFEEDNAESSYGVGRWVALD
ncbi:MAG: hypothetical protein GY943_15615 [Chloroflexi bacterium]|nr:hypothetical protein [Chloroflexota bacterium]